jgi:hypothetical protein
MFRKKKKQVMTINEVMTRVRGFLLDSQIQNPHELSILLGCTPISDEVAEKEEQESDKRMEKVSYLIPVLYAHAHSLAEASTEFERNSEETPQQIPTEVWTYNKKMLHEISMAALLGSISQLVDMGLLSIPKEKR